MSRGLFISFEGPEGSGKTTQLRLLRQRLEANGRRVTENTTEIGTRIRRIMLDPRHREMTPITELLLMVAAQAQAAAEIIRPALTRGDIVLSDRFTDSTLAYQGAGRGLGFDTVRNVQQLSLASLSPDLTLCVMLDIETGLARAACRNRDAREARIDQEPLDFHQRVAAGYLEIAAHDPHRFRIVDGSGDPSQVAARVWSEVCPAVAQNRI